MSLDQVPNGHDRRSSKTALDREDEKEGRLKTVVLLNCPSDLTEMSELESGGVPFCEARLNPQIAIGSYATVKFEVRKMGICGH